MKGISELNRQFIMEVRAKGRVTIDEAVKIAEEMGIFENEDPFIALRRDHKQQIRLLLSRPTYGGERIIRGIRMGGDCFFVDLTDKANILELNILIANEQRKIKRAQRVIAGLRKIKNHQMEGQIKLEDYYPNAL